MTTQLQLQIEGTGQDTAMASGETLLSAGLRAGFNMPHLCLVGECGACRSRLVRGEVQLKKDISQHVDGQALGKGYLLACQCVALSDVVLEVPGLSPASAACPLLSTQGVIEDIRWLNHDITLVTLALAAPLRYTAGQYAQLTVPGHPVLALAPRCYSFAAAPSELAQARVQFHIRKVPGGAFTEWLFGESRVGTTVALTGPLGDFHVHGRARPMVCVAGGSGLAPLYAMLASLSDDPQAPDVTLFLGARTRADLYFQEELARLQTSWRGHGRLLLVPVLSDEAAGSGWDGLTGMVADHLASFCDPALSSFYFCGPPAMVDHLLHHLAGKADAAQIHFDRFLDRRYLAAQPV
ncbi:MAG: 2Fe-2S iron-sulfur cluster binding domain-containing protein [Pseudomonadota bacterium]